MTSAVTELSSGRHQRNSSSCETNIVDHTQKIKLS